jgi:hypothetical protein
MARHTNLLYSHSTRTTEPSSSLRPEGMITCFSSVSLQRAAFECSSSSNSSSSSSSSRCMQLALPAAYHAFSSSSSGFCYWCFALLMRNSACKKELSDAPSAASCVELCVSLSIVALHEGQQLNVSSKVLSFCSAHSSLESCTIVQVQPATTVLTAAAQQSVRVCVCL